MEVGLKRTTIARIAAGLGSLCGAIGLVGRDHGYYIEIGAAWMGYGGDSVYVNCPLCAGRWDGFIREISIECRLQALRD